MRQKACQKKFVLRPPALIGELDKSKEHLVAPHHRSNLTQRMCLNFFVTVPGLDNVAGRTKATTGITHEQEFFWGLSPCQ